MQMCSRFSFNKWKWGVMDALGHVERFSLKINKTFAGTQMGWMADKYTTIGFEWFDGFVKCLKKCFTFFLPALVTTAITWPISWNDITQDFPSFQLKKNLSMLDVSYSARNATSVYSVDSCFHVKFGTTSETTVDIPSVKDWSRQLWHLMETKRIFGRNFGIRKTFSFHPCFQCSRRNERQKRTPIFFY